MQTLDGEEALRIGLCDRLAPLEGVRAAAHALAAEIAASGPLAIESIRKTMRGDLAERIARATARERQEQERAGNERTIFARAWPRWPRAGSRSSNDADYFVRLGE